LGATRSAPKAIGQSTATATAPAEELFWAVLEPAPDAVLVIDESGEIVFVNVLLEELFGYRRTELVGQRVELLMPEQFRAGHVAHREGFAAAPKIRHAMGPGRQLIGLRRDGSQFPIEVAIGPLRTSARTLMSATIRDVSERHEALLVAGRLAAIVENSEDAIIGKDLSGVIVSWNPGAERLYGYSASEMIGRDHTVLVAPNHDDSVPAAIRRVTAGETVAPFEAVRRRKDGSLVSVLLRFSPLRTSVGELIGVSVIVRDNTERKAFERVAGLLAEAEAIAGLGSYEIDIETQQAVWSEQVYELFGLVPEDVPLGDSSALRDLLTPETRDAYEALLDQVITTGAPGETTLEIQRPDGDRRWLQARVRRVLDEGSARVVGTVLDVTKSRVEEIARREAERRFELAFERAPIGVAITGVTGEARGQILKANTAMAQMLGRGPGELDGLMSADLTHPDDLESTETAFEAVAANELVQFEKRFQHRDGHAVSALVSSAPVMDDAGRTPLYCVTQVLDISERKRFESELRFLAHHDALTGLFNRQRFESELARVVAEHRRYEHSSALLMLDLDGFKAVNDRFGHPAGDELLSRVADLLRAEVRATDVIARLGGDEFAIIVHEPGEYGAATVAEKILATVRTNGFITQGDEQARVTASIGITMLDARSVKTGEELVVEADVAMYEAKEQGRNRYAIFDRAAGQEVQFSERHSWLDRIHAALDNDGFVLHAQPITGICGDRTGHYELLLRMVDERGDLIKPAAFLYNAERFDLMGRIDRWVLRRAISMLHESQRAGHQLTLAVNISGKTMNDLALADDLARILDEHPIEAGTLIVEVTETAAIVNINRARELATQLRKLGCRFALDDFGAGFASFYYLKHLDFDFLKIDGEFIKRLKDTPTDQLVVKAVVDIAAGLGSQTVAEFVGDDDTVELLRTLGVDYGQGYHLGRPAPLTQQFPTRVPLHS
jgi:diguanylate cyclase (GGDEF)-like protein/PAS domain S-box-containing protein